MGIFVPKCSETHGKGLKIYVSSDREEGKSPRTLKYHILLILPIQEVNNRARLLIMSGLVCDNKGKKVVTKLKSKGYTKHKLRKNFY